MVLNVGGIKILHLLRFGFDPSVQSDDVVFCLGFYQRSKNEAATPNLCDSSRCCLVTCG